MAKSNSFFNIDMLVLSLLKVSDCYGYELVKNVKSIKIKIEAKKTSTGANIGSTQNQHANSSGVGDTLECWGYTGTKVTFYGTHDAIHTTGYHVYTSTQY